VNKSINCTASDAYKHLFLREILSAPTRSSSNEYPFNSVFKVPTLVKVLAHTMRPFEVPPVVVAVVFEVPLAVVVEALVVVVVVVVTMIFELFWVTVPPFTVTFVVAPGTVAFTDGLTPFPFTLTLTLAPFVVVCWVELFVVVPTLTFVLAPGRVLLVFC